MSLVFPFKFEIVNERNGMVTEILRASVGRKKNVKMINLFLISSLLQGQQEKRVDD